MRITVIATLVLCTLTCAVALAGCSGSDERRESRGSTTAAHQPARAHRSVQRIPLSRGDARRRVIAAERRMSQGANVTHTSFVAKLTPRSTTSLPAMLRQLRGTLVIRRTNGDESTALGRIRSGLLSSRATARTHRDRLEIRAGTRRLMHGSAAGISLDVGRELLEHRDLWTVLHGACSPNDETCRIEVALPRRRLIAHLAPEPPGQLVAALRSLNRLTCTVTVRRGEIATTVITARGRGVQLRINERYVRASGQHDRS